MQSQLNIQNKKMCAIRYIVPEMKIAWVLKPETEFVDFLVVCSGYSHAVLVSLPPAARVQQAGDVAKGDDQ